MVDVLINIQRKHINNCIGLELCADGAGLFINIYTSNRVILNVEYVYSKNGSCFMYKGIKLQSITKLIEKSLP